MLENIKTIFKNYFQSFIEILPKLTTGVILLVVFWLLGGLLKKTVKKRLQKKMDDQLLVNFIGRVVYIIFIIIGIVLFLGQIGLGTAAGGLLAGAGVSAVVIGFAFKDIGENFLSGFFLAFSRPFSIGDVIEIEGTTGTVKALKFRDSHVRTFDGKDVYIPNGILIKNQLINYTRDGLLRHNFMVGIDYEDDPIRAIETIMNTLKANKDIGQEGGIKPFVMIDEFATSTINLNVFYWTNTNSFEGDIAGLKNRVMNEVLASVANEFSLPADIVELKIYQEGQPIPLKIKKEN